MAEPSIRVENVSKVYRLWNSPAARLRYSVLSQIHRALRPALPPEAPLLRSLAERRRLQGGEFHALRGVSLEVEQGESVGIIGRNGSGKSTLLQLIAGTLTPTAGTIAVRGRVAALLELGSGFNGEFTGRENVFLNAALLGLSRAETEARFDRIAAFADIGPFLDQPVKTYSSGMTVRLAFAVQTAVDPDVLIVDEALSVGDVYFQNKCFRLLRERLDAGLTLLFVSHDTSAVRALCDRGLFLEAGQAVFFGPSDEAVNAYVRSGDAPREEPAAPRTGAPSAPPAQTPVESKGWLVPRTLGAIQDQIGDREVEVLGAASFDAAGQPVGVFDAGAPIVLGFRLRAREAVDDLLVGYALRDRLDNVLGALTTDNEGQERRSLAAGEEVVIYLKLEGRLGGGAYLVDFGVGGGTGPAGQAGRHYHRVGGILAFNVVQRPEAVRFQGLCDLGGRFSADTPPI